MTHSAPLTLSRMLLRLLIVLNLLAGVLILALLVASLVAEAWVVRALGVPAGRPALVVGMRLVMAAGIASVPLAYIVLSRLLAIVETVRSDDPFVGANAARLTAIAWALLGLELLRLGVVGIASAASFHRAGIDLGTGFAVTPWLSILLVFVLARVFAQGAAMRADLEGTI
jgi:hypothetical protein